MNKTININIGGLSFNIDENAYSKLERYLNAIENSLDPVGKEEVIKDIEMRISEIFLDKIPTSQHVIDSSIVDSMIAIMGQPEDYIIEESSGNQQKTTFGKSKKLYRDIDDNLLGGVCAGLGHYLGIDTLWIRLIVVIILFISFGSTFLIYVLLWILIPQANTTSKKIEMKGEPVNLSNIEKKVKENLENVKEEAGKVGKKSSEVVTNFGMTFFNVIVKVVGVFISLFSGLLLISLIMGFFASAFGLGVVNNNPITEFMDLFLVDGIPFWVISLIIFLALAIPLVFLLILGLKLLIDNMNSIGNLTKYTLLGIWLMSIIFLLYFGIKQSQEFSYKGISSNKLELPFTAKDTLLLSFVNFDDNSIDDDADYSLWDSDFRIKNGSDGTLQLMMKDIQLEVLTTENTTPYLQIIKQSKGNSFENANQRAEKIDYQIMVEGNHIKLNKYFYTNLKTKYRDQKIKLKLFVPNGHYFYLNESVENYSDFDYSIMDSKPYNEVNTLYLSEDKLLKCMSCTSASIDEDYVDDSIINDSIQKISLQINDKEVLLAEPKKGRLVIDKNGTVTKQ